MQKDAFHQAVVGGLSFHGVLTADGPAIVGHAVRGGTYAGGVALVVSGLRRFVPEHFGKGPGVTLRLTVRLHVEFYQVFAYCTQRETLRLTLRLTAKALHLT